MLFNKFPRMPSTMNVHVKTGCGKHGNTYHCQILVCSWYSRYHSQTRRNKHVCLRCKHLHPHHFQYVTEINCNCLMVSWEIKAQQRYVVYKIIFRQMNASKNVCSKNYLHHYAKRDKLVPLLLQYCIMQTVPLYIASQLLYILNLHNYIHMHSHKTYPQFHWWTTHLRLNKQHFPMFRESLDQVQYAIQENVLLLYGRGRHMQYECIFRYIVQDSQSQKSIL